MICYYLKWLWPKTFISSQRAAVRSLKNTNFHFYYITSPNNFHRDGKHPGLALPCLLDSLWEEKTCTKARCLLDSRMRRPLVGCNPKPSSPSHAARRALLKEQMSPGWPAFVLVAPSPLFPTLIFSICSILPMTWKTTQHREQINAVTENVIY